MDLLGMEGGIDVMSELFGGRTYFGAMGGYLSSDNIRVFKPPLQMPAVIPKRRWLVCMQPGFRMIRTGLSI